MNQFDKRWNGGVQDLPLVSIVIPALDEELTIGEFVDWCFEGLRRAGVSGQVLIVDSSTDRTSEIAESKRAEVLRVPKRGLGRAYIDAIPYIRAKYVIMGDADLTYDFREIQPFIEKFEEGFEFIMGSRFRGSIEPGAMPLLHRYFGTPITTLLLNIVYGTHFSDIHCGMRGITLSRLKSMALKSQSWQYASEMIIKAVHLEMKTSEVPVRFHKDHVGRQSHLKRIGWYAPWQAGWLTLETLFIHGADFFIAKPGWILFLLGVIGIACLYNGPINILGKLSFSLHWMLLFLLSALIGLQAVLMGFLAKYIYGIRSRMDSIILPYFSIGRAILISSGIGILGFFNTFALIWLYISDDYQLPQQIGVESFRAVAGLGLIISGFIYFSFSLIYNAFSLYHPVNSRKNDLI